MIKCKNDYAEKIVKLFVPDDILKLKPVIAGGFISSIFYNIIFNKDSETKIKALKSQLIRNTIFSGGKGFNYKKVLAKELNFGDIDFWFTKSNPIHTSSHQYHRLHSLLVSDFYYDEEKIIFSSSITSDEAYSDLDREVIKKIGLTLTKTSQAANTFVHSDNNWLSYPVNIQLQFVKYLYESIEETINSFDIINCAAAYHDGCFYYHEDLPRLVEEQVIEFADLKTKYLVSKMISVNRAFKYAKRYNAYFNDKTSKDIFQVFLEAEDLKRKLDELKGSKIQSNKRSIWNDLSVKQEIKVKLSGLSDSFDPYQKGNELSVSFLNNLMKSLIRNFELFTRMPSFKRKYIPYFIESPFPEVKKIVEEVCEGKRKVGIEVESTLIEDIEGYFDIPF